MRMHTATTTLSPTHLTTHVPSKHTHAHAHTCASYASISATLTDTTQTPSPHTDSTMYSGNMDTRPHHEAPPAPTLHPRTFTKEKFPLPPFTVLDLSKPRNRHGTLLRHLIQANCLKV